MHYQSSPPSLGICLISIGVSTQRTRTRTRHSPRHSQGEHVVKINNMGSVDTGIELVKKALQGDLK